MVPPLTFTLASFFDKVESDNLAYWMESDKLACDKLARDKGEVQLRRILILGTSVNN